MEFVELDIKEFSNFASKHELFSFHQTEEWANLKKKNGWSSCYVGLKNNDEIVGASLLLYKKIPVVGNMFYSPRGYLIDYKNKDIIKEFTDGIRKYIKSKNGFFIKIDPYYSYRQRDVDGNIVENGYINDDVINELKHVGYKHYGFNNDMTELQPRFIFVLPVLGKTEEEIMNNMSKQTKRHITHAINEGVVVEEVDKSNIDDFANIMAHTSSRRGFIDRPKSYYVNMLETFKDNIKIIDAVFYPSKAIESNKSKLDELENRKKEVEERVNTIGNQKSIDALSKVKEDIDKTNEKIKYLEDMKNKYGERIVMSSSMFMLYGNEVLYLFGGSYDCFMKFNSQYLLQWEMIKYAINNNYARYNFYGIEGDFSEKNGVYNFKKGFNGEVVEFIGEFDLITNKFKYMIYKVTFFLYKKIKGLKLLFRRHK